MSAGVISSAEVTTGPLALNPRTGVLTRRGAARGGGVCGQRQSREAAATSQTHRSSREVEGAEGAQACPHLLDFGPRLQSCEQRSACSFKPLFVVICWGGPRTQAHSALV